MDQLVNVIQRLHEALGALGDASIRLPAIVAVGSQSSGKSSVLENIVGRCVRWHRRTHRTSTIDFREGDWGAVREGLSRLRCGNARGTAGEPLSPSSPPSPRRFAARHATLPPSLAPQ
jgi:hypothetical protein